MLVKRYKTLIWCIKIVGLESSKEPSLGWFTFAYRFYNPFNKRIEVGWWVRGKMLERFVGGQVYSWVYERIGRWVGGV